LFAPAQAGGLGRIHIDGFWLSVSLFAGDIDPGGIPAASIQRSLRSACTVWRAPRAVDRVLPRLRNRSKGSNRRFSAGKMQ
jgi:hypothetical protein